MTREQIRKAVEEELIRLAPEAEVDSLSADTRLRDDLDLDSFDFQKLVAALDERLGVNVPEADYRQLETLGGCLDYLAAHQPAQGA